MILKLAVVLLVVTPCVFGLSQQEIDQFGGIGCTPDAGATGSAVTASLSGTTATITSNHVPNHVWESVNPNSPAASPTTYTFTTPAMLSDDQVRCLPQGPIAIAKNGVLIFNPTTREGGNAYTDEEMDCNGGHSDGMGSYHYHSLPDNGVVYDSSYSSSQFIGVAFDGLPIYSIGDGISTSDLDICHGMYVGSEYRYIASMDHFPYFIGCYRAMPQRGGAQASCSGMGLGSSCTCQFGVLNFKKRALLDLLDELINERKVSPKLSWMKRQACTGTCGVTGTTTAGGAGGQGPVGGGQGPVGGGQGPVGGGQGPVGGGQGPVGGGQGPMGGGQGPNGGGQGPNGGGQGPNGGGQGPNGGGQGPNGGGQGPNGGGQGPNGVGQGPNGGGQGPMGGQGSMGGQSGQGGPPMGGPGGRGGRGRFRFQKRNKQVVQALVNLFEALEEDN